MHFTIELGTPTKLLRPDFEGRPEQTFTILIAQPDRAKP